MRYLLVLLCIAIASIASADATLPTTDITDAHDIVFLGRYEESKIVAYKQSGFDRIILPLSPLKSVPDQRDSHNNILFAPQQSKTVEGEHTRLVYLMPADRSPLEVLQNYQQEITEKGGSLLFHCEKSGCGGATDRSSSGGGGDMSLAMFLQPEEDVTAYNKPFSNGYCALTSRIVDQHYLVAEMPKQNAFVSVLTYTLSGGSFCKAFDRHSIAVVDVILVKSRAQKMVVIQSDEMAEKIGADGKIALYGIYFDTDKAVIKDTSQPTLDEIAKLLQQQRQLKLLIVGHTDNAGSFDYNVDLSKRRAAAVVTALSSNYNIDEKRLEAVGVSYACPAASNRTEEGRTKNRRVVLVEQ